MLGLTPDVVELTGILLILSISVYLTFHFGIFSVAHVGLMGIGAYAAGLASSDLELPFALCLVLGALAGALLSWLISPVLNRVSGVYLALATLAIAEIIRTGLMLGDSVTGGVRGLSGISAEGSAEFAVVLAAAMALVIFAINRSPLGRIAVAMRDDERWVTSSGIQIQRIRRFVFVLSGGMAGLSGAVYAHYITYLTPNDFGFARLVSALTFTVIGGITNWLGPIVGTVGLQFGTQLDTGLDNEYVLLIYGAMLIVVMVMMPKGLVGHLGQYLSNRQARKALKRGEGVEPSAPAGDSEVKGGRLRAEDVTVEFEGLTALDNVSVALEPGRMCGLIGPNGAGKTTLVNVLTGFQSPSAGRVVLDSDDVTGSRAAEIASTGVRRTFQQGGLVLKLTALENVLLGEDGLVGPAKSLLSPRFRPAEVARAVECLNRVGVGDIASRVGSELGYGERRRVEIARCLFSDPRVLILDEPAAGLTQQETQSLEGVIASLAEQGLAVMLIEHNLDLVLSISDHVVVLNVGSLLAEGSVSEIREDRRVISAYLGQTPTSEKTDA